MLPWIIFRDFKFCSLKLYLEIPYWYLYFLFFRREHNSTIRRHLHSGTVSLLWLLLYSDANVQWMYMGTMHLYSTHHLYEPMFCTVVLIREQYKTFCLDFLVDWIKLKLSMVSDIRWFQCSDPRGWTRIAQYAKREICGDFLLSLHDFYVGATYMNPIFQTFVNSKFAVSLSSVSRNRRKWSWQVICSLFGAAEWQ